jgi:hypothetical protein
MRALKQDEIDYLLALGLSTEAEWNLTRKERARLAGLERRLRNLGILKIEIKPIPGYQRTIYCYTKRGRKIRREVSVSHAVLRAVKELRCFLRAHDERKMSDTNSKVRC